MEEMINQNSVNAENFGLYVIPFFGGIKANPLRFVELKIPEDKPVMNLILSANAILSKTVIELNKIFLDEGETEETEDIVEQKPKIKKFKISLSPCSTWYTVKENDTFIGTLLIRDKNGVEPDIELLIVLKKEE